VLIAAITSCTNTSNPSVMLAAGLLAKKAVEKGPERESRREGLARARIARRHRLPQEDEPQKYLNKLKLQLVGYGCTTCIGNSGPLDAASKTPS
jgi:aconitate hydratase